MATTTTGSGPITRTDAHALTALDWALLFLRIGLGVVFFAHGAQKVFGWFGGPGLANTVGFMGHMGIPAPLAYISAFTELLGGLGVLLGVLTRLASLGLAINMLVAIFHVHLANGFFADKGGFEYPFTLLMIALALLAAGPGHVAFGDWEPTWLRRTTVRS
ncbi:MAG TPA: DoxX family protein [Chthonomonadaceae bacterium]|nr:DoxX family protein [Chthonomonadaceae bacterium]